jgi:hypothetical protein
MDLGQTWRRKNRLYPKEKGKGKAHAAQQEQLTNNQLIMQHNKENMVIVPRNESQKQEAWRP